MKYVYKIFILCLLGTSTCWSAQQALQQTTTSEPQSACAALLAVAREIESIEHHLKGCRFDIQMGDTVMPHKDLFFDHLTTRLAKAKQEAQRLAEPCATEIKTSWYMSALAVLGTVLTIVYTQRHTLSRLVKTVVVR